MSDYIYGMLILLLLAGVWGFVLLKGMNIIKGAKFKITGGMFSVFLFIAIGVAILAVGAFMEFHETPGFCGDYCHIMDPIQEAYLDPGNNTFMAIHLDNEITCLDCHTGPGLMGQIDTFIGAPKEVYSLVFGGYDMYNLHGHVPSENCLKGCHEDMDWRIEAAGSEMWHPFTENGTDFTELEEREICSDCHDARWNGIGSTAESCGVCHDLTVEELEAHGEQTCGGEDCHEHTKLIGHRVGVDNCMLCHDNNHPEEASLPFNITNHHGTFEADSSFCSPCHSEVYDVFFSSQSGHMTGTDGCLECHEEHKLQNECISCHNLTDISHSVQSPYNDCLNCHVSGGHDPFDITFTGITRLDNDFCMYCHFPETDRINDNIHHLTDCVDCHPEHGVLSVSFSGCLCHGEVPAFHNASTTDCQACHDTTIIHSDPNSMTFSDTISFENDFCINCHALEGERLSYAIHQYTDCTDCHSEHGTIRVIFDYCLCHDDIPSFHDENMTECESCHDTSVIHAPP